MVRDVGIFEILDTFDDHLETNKNDILKNDQNANWEYLGTFEAIIESVGNILNSS